MRRWARRAAYVAGAALLLIGAYVALAPAAAGLTYIDSMNGNLRRCNTVRLAYQPFWDVFALAPTSLQDAFSWYHQQWDWFGGMLESTMLDPSPPPPPGRGGI